jgi:hypothetical protein
MRVFDVPSSVSTLSDSDIDDDFPQKGPFYPGWAHKDFRVGLFFGLGEEGEGYCG